jgi:protein SERAC1
MRESDLLAALETGSETLQNVTDYFVPMMRNFRIYFFWEAERTRAVLLGPRGDYVVSQDSAAPVHDDTERAGIAADHRGMVKFESPDAQGFQMVAEALERYCEDAPGVVRERRAKAVHVLGVERGNAVTELLLLGTTGRQGSFTPPLRGLSGRVESSAISSSGGFTMMDCGRSGTFRSITGGKEEQSG